MQYAGSIACHFLDLVAIVYIPLTLGLSRHYYPCTFYKWDQSHA